MISQLNPPDVKVLSLTTIASPHRGKYSSAHCNFSTLNIVGSAFADFCFERIGSRLEESFFVDFDHKLTADS